MVAIVEFRNVTKRYPMYHAFSGGVKSFLSDLPASIRRLRQEQFIALEKISLNIRRGESVGIVGRNGAGKSTILSLIAGVIKARCFHRLLLMPEIIARSVALIRCAAEVACRVHCKLFGYAPEGEPVMRPHAFAKRIHVRVVYGLAVGLCCQH